MESDGAVGAVPPEPPTVQVTPCTVSDEVEFQDQTPHKTFARLRVKENDCLKADMRELKKEILEGNLENVLTLVFTTSVVPTNPETCFFESVVASYSKVEPAIRTCRKIIVCDAEFIRDDSRSNEFRTGRVNSDASVHYQEYKRRLVRLCEDAKNDETHPFYRAETLLIKQRHGFGLAVRHALQLVTTPYVMVIQHDRTVIKPFGLLQLMSKFQSYSMRHVNYVCLGTRATWNHGRRTVAEFGVDVRDYVLPLEGTEYSLVPLAFWYDTSHIARTSFYRNFAMERHILSVHGSTSWKWKVGEFIEDKLGQILRWQMKEIGYAAMFRFGTYLIVHNEDKSLSYPAVAGRSKHSMQWYMERYFPPEQTKESKAASSLLNNNNSQVDEVDEDEDEDEEEEENGENIRRSDREKHVLVRHANQRKVRTLVRLLIMEKGEDHELVDTIKGKGQEQQERMEKQAALMAAKKKATVEAAAAAAK